MRPGDLAVTTSEPVFLFSIEAFSDRDRCYRSCGRLSRADIVMVLACKATASFLTINLVVTSRGEVGWITSSWLEPVP